MQGAVIHPVLNFDHRSGDATVTSADAILAQADKLGVKIGQVRTLSTDRLGRRLGVVSPEELARVIDGLFEIVG
jgi:mRNA interferase MazF